MSWVIVSTHSLETIIQEDWRKQAEAEGEAGSEWVDDLPRGKPSLVRVGPSQVEVELVEGSLGQEVGAILKALQVEAFIFD